MFLKLSSFKAPNVESYHVFNSGLFGTYTIFNCQKYQSFNVWSNIINIETVQSTNKTWNFLMNSPAPKYDSYSKNQSYKNFQNMTKRKNAKTRTHRKHKTRKREVDQMQKNSASEQQRFLQLPADPLREISTPANPLPVGEICQKLNSVPSMLMFHLFGLEPMP